MHCDLTEEEHPQPSDEPCPLGYPIDWGWFSLNHAWYGWCRDPDIGRRCAYAADPHAGQRDTSAAPLF
jgi:hypothetical protein